ncbi:CG11723 [Drosophila busckii]|uniref:CG11723 n=2 Tax=Drosophila busckii TaxID=30019 RepID=A0A0M3QYV0_DROBS|nr:CG11723 [Drosophila busckii]
MLDSFQLIAEVRQRPVLWDSRIALAERRSQICAAWQEVADAMQQEVVVCRKRFKGLRDSYRMEVRKMQSGMKNATTWIYFGLLEFMRGIFDPNNLLTLAIEPPAADMDIEEQKVKIAQQDEFVIDIDDNDEDDDFDFEILGDIFNPGQAQARPPSPALLKRLMPPPPPPPPLPAKPTKRARPSTSVDRNSSSSSPLTAAAEPANAKQDDADYNFLISLLPHVKALSSMNNMKFRTEVSHMLMELNHEQEAQAQAQAQSQRVKSPQTILHTSPIECDVKIENEPMTDTDA